MSFVNLEQQVAGDIARTFERLTYPLLGMIDEEARATESYGRAMDAALSTLLARHDALFDALRGGVSALLASYEAQSNELRVKINETMFAAIKAEQAASETRTRRMTLLVEAMKERRAPEPDLPERLVGEIIEDLLVPMPVEAQAAINEEPVIPAFLLRRREETTGEGAHGVVRNIMERMLGKAPAKLGAERPPEINDTVRPLTIDPLSSDDDDEQVVNADRE